MAVFESIHDNLLQGVSQQVPRSRLPGQLTMQENMISDPVTGLRRRPGSVVRYILDAPEATPDSIKAWRTDIGGVSCDCVLDVNSGTLNVVEGADGSRVSALQSDYLKADDIRMIRHASVGDSLYLANISKTPTGVVSNNNKQNPALTGFAYIKASALSKGFSVTVAHSGGTWTGTYTTPDGTDTGHLAQTTVEYIATQIRQKLIDAGASSAGGVSIYREGPYLFFRITAPNTDLSVTTSSGSTYIQASNSSEIRSSSDLPPRLPPQADNMIVATGTVPTLAYYRYEAAKARWVETSAYGSITSLQNMPVEVYYDADGDKWAIDASAWDARLTGDDLTNPDPDFVGWGITGLSAYQGRLVILSGSWVWLSEAGKPKTFYRTTVEDLPDSDPIGIGSSSASSAAFQYALPFNKDLVLFSNEFQALIPGATQAVSPRNINLLVTSTYSVDVAAQPITTGPSLMYSIPRSRHFFGMMEMLPSPYADSQYVSQDATEHIPRYMPGRCRFAVSSSVGSIVALGSTQDTRALYMHEYMWEGEEKVLRAWHRWSFKYRVAYAYFSGDLINILTVRNGKLIACTVDPRSGQDPEAGNSTGYLDYSTVVPVHDDPDGKYAALEQDMLTFFGGDESDAQAAYRGGSLDGYEIGLSYDEDTNRIVLNRSTTAQEVVVGMGFVSRFAPSPPVLRGEDELPITTSSLRLLKYFVTTSGSGPFEVSVSDTATQTPQRVWDVNPVRWLSTDLTLGTTPVNGETGNVIRCGVHANSSQVVFKATSLYDFNVLSLEYTCKHNQRTRRR